MKNLVILIGNLGADPDLRTMQDGRLLLTMSLATNETWRDKQGQPQQRTDWHRCVLWSKPNTRGDSRAEALGKILRTGMRVMVEGSLRTFEYEDRGEKRKGTEVAIREIEILTPRSKRDDAGDWEEEHTGDHGSAHRGGQQRPPQGRGEEPRPTGRGHA